MTDDFLRQEAKQVLRRTLREHAAEGHADEVLVWAAFQKTDWNDLQSAVSTARKKNLTDLSADAATLSSSITRIDEMLRDALRSYLHGHA